jgi:hypothetical protein
MSTPKVMVELSKDELSVILYWYRVVANESLEDDEDDIVESKLRNIYINHVKSLEGKQ